MMIGQVFLGHDAMTSSGIPFVLQKSVHSAMLPMYKVYGTRDLRALSEPSSYKPVGLFIHTSMGRTRGVSLLPECRDFWSSKGIPLQVALWDTWELHKPITEQFIRVVTRSRSIKQVHMHTSP